MPYELVPYPVARVFDTLLCVALSTMEEGTAGTAGRDDESVLAPAEVLVVAVVVDTGVDLAAAAAGAAPVAADAVSQGFGLV